MLMSSSHKSTVFSGFKPSRSNFTHHRVPLSLRIDFKRCFLFSKLLMLFKFMVDQLTLFMCLQCVFPQCCFLVSKIAAFLFCFIFLLANYQILHLQCYLHLLHIYAFLQHCRKCTKGGIDLNVKTLILHFAPPLCFSLWTGTAEPSPKPSPC